MQLPQGLTESGVAYSGLARSPVTPLGHHMHYAQIVVYLGPMGFAQGQIAPVMID